MILRLNLSLRRVLMASMGLACSFSASQAGMVDTRYDLQYYLDFSRNKGMFSAGATNIAVYYKDGSSVSNPVIPIMPNLDGYAQKMQEEGFVLGVLQGYGGCGLTAPQFVTGAAHVGENPVLFLTEDGDMSTVYTSAGYKAYSTDVEVQRLNKIVTEVAYTPMADDAFIRGLTRGTWLWRLGDGMQYNSSGETISSRTGSNTLGGIVGIDSVGQNAGGDWVIEVGCRENDTATDLRTPLDIGLMFGDSGSPLYAWDAQNERFVFVVACSQGTTNAGFNNLGWLRSNPGKVQGGMDSYTVAVNQFAGVEKILWNAQDAVTGKGLLSQGDVTVEYTGKGSGNALADTLGLSFSSSDVGSEQVLELQSSVDMGAGAMTFELGRWKMTEKDSAYTFNSAGFVVNAGAELTLELTAGANEEWRKVGEGTLTIGGNGNNEVLLRVGGGTTQYNVSYDDNGNIIGCTLGNIGETRLNRKDGYAAGEVRLEGGVASLVLMQDNQFKTNSVGGDTFTFGNDGGLLNLNGHDLSWGVINQEDSGIGARIGNYTPLGELAPSLSTFTYTGSGTFAGCFMDEGEESTAKLAVRYSNTEGGIWTLSGNNSNVGGYTVEAGTLRLQGYNTPHVYHSDSGDWMYATMEGSNVVVKNGATFQLSHHALMRGNVHVESGGAFVINQTVNAAMESVQGSARHDMAEMGLTSLVGNVTLSGDATMMADIVSPVETVISGNITGISTNVTQFTKQGEGVLVVDGVVNVPVGAVQAGGLVIKDSTQTGNWWRWSIGEKGFLAVEGMDNASVLRYVGGNSFGVLALTQNQEDELNLTNYQNLIIGAWGDVSYGTADRTLTTVTDATYGNVWRLGGGTGTLTVNFKLSGDADLLIGNEWSSGTVHLANTENNFSGDIYILGAGNKLSYEAGALGAARVNLTYGNALALYESSMLDIIKPESEGVLALQTNDELDLRGMNLSVGADGEQTYRGNLLVDDVYRFGGSGQLTLDTELLDAERMIVDGQGTTGSSVTFARENAYTGTIVAGGGISLATANSQGEVAIHLGHESALAAASSILLQKGARLYTDGKDVTLNNLTMQSGSSLRNNGTEDSSVLLNVEAGVTTSLADGVLSSSADSAALRLVKSGKGTLALAVNADWNGGLTIDEGTVKANITSDGKFTSTGGIGAASNTIHVSEAGTLSLMGVKKQGYELGGTCLLQTVSGTGTVEFSTGGSALFSEQPTSFEGTIKLLGNTRLYVGTQLTTDYYFTYKNNRNAVNDATIDIEDGSQVRIGSGLRYLKTDKVSLDTDFIISGQGFKGVDTGLVHSNCNAGALSIDCDATVHGNITLKDDASIASWSAGTLLTAVSQWSACTTGSANASYALKGNLGGTVRGRILGEGKTLTISGNEGLTFTADSANTYGNLVIASSGNGHNDDKFALRLNGGKAVSQTSTALGLGQVKLGDGLILRFAGTGVADNSNVVYTYANAISAGNGATLQGYNITNRLAGAVSMAGDSLNLATAQGGVLELTGGINGNGVLNIAAGSQILLGGGAASFAGTVAAGAGVSLSLADASVLSSSTVISATDSLALSLMGTQDYSFGGITLTPSAEDGTATLQLGFDFAGTPDAGDASTWSTLVTDISAEETVVSLALNMFNDVEMGSYTLATGDFSGSFSLADTLNGRLSLQAENGALVLNVAADNRLYWAGNGAGQNWNASEANWYLQTEGKNVSFSSGAHVVFDSSGVGENNSTTSREVVMLEDAQTPGAMVVKDSGAYYELDGSGSLTSSHLTVGLGGDLKLGVASASFSDGVLVHGAALEVNGTALTAALTTEAGSRVALANGAKLQGNLSVTDATVSIASSTVDGAISLLGTGSLSMDGAKLGSNRISFADGSGLSLSNATLSGELSWMTGSDTVNVSRLGIDAGSVDASSSMQMAALSMASGSSLTISGSKVSSIETISGNGILKVADGSTATLALGDASLANLNLMGGTTHVSGTVNLGNDARLSVGKAELQIDAGGTITTTHFRSGDEGKNHPSVISINTGGTLNITGSTNVDNTHTSFLLAHWGNSASGLSLNGGTLNARNTSMLMGWDSGATFTALAGEANLKGVRFSTARSSAEVFRLGSATEGSARINLGADGISGIGTNDTVSLGRGTLGALASYSISGNGGLNLLDSTEGTVFDTDAYTVTVNTALTGNGNLVKQGSGTLVLNHASSELSGHIRVEEGALAIGSNAAASLFGTVASVSMGSGTTLDLTRMNFGEDFEGICIGAQSSLSLSDSVVVAFGALESGTTYNVFSMANGVLPEGWNIGSMGLENFSINGTLLSDMGRAEVVLGMTGSFSYTLSDGWDLVWEGGDSGVWNKDSSNSAWETTRADAMSGVVGTFSTGFMNNDNVLFSSDANLTVEDGVMVNNVALEDGVQLTTQGNLTVNGALSVGKGASWAFSGDTALSFTEAQLQNMASVEVGEGATLTMTALESSQNATSTAFNRVSGSGDVVLELKNDNGVGFNLDAVSGDITVKTGRLQVNTSRFNAASTLKLASSDSQLVFNAVGTDLANNVELQKSTTIHVNNGKSGKLSGIVSGEGGLTKAGAGTMTFRSQNTYEGTTTIGGGKIVLDMASGGTYELKNTVSGSGTLEVATGTTLANNGKKVSAALLVNGGVAEFSVGDSKSLSAGTTVQNGGILRFTGGSDILDYNASGKSITVNGGSVEFGNTRQTMGSWTLRLSNNARVTGQGGTYDVGTAAMDFNNGGTIYATSGDNSISATTRLRYGSTITYDVAGGASLDVSGIVHADGGRNGGIVKNNAGALTLNNARNDMDSIVVNGGSADIHGAAAYTLVELRAAQDTELGFYAGDTGDTSTEASVRVSGTASFAAGAELRANLTMAGGAKLDVASGGVLMGSTVTLESGISLSDDLLARIITLGAGESETLFSGVDALTLIDGTTSFTFNPGELGVGDGVLAETYFSNLSGADYRLTFADNGSGEGAVAITVVPEPAGATLSLLALAALASRRRRK